MKNILDIIKEVYEEGNTETKLAITIMFLTDDMISAKNDIKEIQRNQKNFAMLLEQHEKSIQEIERKLKNHETKQDI